MRIIAGKYGGRVIFAPSGSTTRPTTDRVRESLMSTLASACGGFVGVRVLDAFAGSGALSFESLSRGAAHAMLFDRDPRAFQTIVKNKDALRVPAEAITLCRRDIFSYPFKPNAFPPFDVLFFDPPYATAPCDVAALISRLDAAGLIAPGALISYEHAPLDGSFIDELGCEGTFKLVCSKLYGETVIDIIRCGNAEE